MASTLFNLGALHPEVTQGIDNFIARKSRLAMCREIMAYIFSIRKNNSVLNEEYRFYSSERKMIMKKRFEELFDKAVEWAGITLAIMGALVVITIIAIVIIVQVLKALAIVAIGLCITMALGMMVWACVSQVMEGHKKEDKKN